MGDVGTTFSCSVDPRRTKEQKLILEWEEDGSVDIEENELHHGIEMNGLNELRPSIEMGKWNDFLSPVNRTTLSSSGNEKTRKPTTVRRLSQLACSLCLSATLYDW